MIRAEQCFTISCDWHEAWMSVDQCWASAYDLTIDTHVMGGECLYEVFADVVTVIYLMSAFARESCKVHIVLPATNRLCCKVQPCFLEVLLICCEGLWPTESEVMMLGENERVNGNKAKQDNWETKIPATGERILVKSKGMRWDNRKRSGHRRQGDTNSELGIWQGTLPNCCWAIQDQPRTKRARELTSSVTRSDTNLKKWYERGARWHKFESSLNLKVETMSTTPKNKERQDEMR